MNTAPPRQLAAHPALAAATPQLPRAAPGRPLLCLFEAAAAPADLASMHALLAGDEAERAARFRFDADRTVSIAARAALRRLLARTLDADPARLRFAYDGHGKPALLDDPALHFNVAHAGGVVAIALDRDGRVGVDVEPVRAERVALEVAREYFAPRERDAFERAPPARRAALFFALWTLKEAYLKARGTGLSLPLDRVEFEPDADPRRIALLHAPDDEPARWSFAAGLFADQQRWSLARECAPDAAAELQIATWRAPAAPAASA